MGSGPSTHVDRDGSIGDGRIDARNLAFGDAIVRVNLRVLADQHVPGLGFGDLYLRFEERGVGDAREIGAGLHLGPDVNLNQLQDARMPARTLRASASA